MTTEEIETLQAAYEYEKLEVISRNGNVHDWEKIVGYCVSRAFGCEFLVGINCVRQSEKSGKWHGSRASFIGDKEDIQKAADAFARLLEQVRSNPLPYRDGFAAGVREALDKSHSIQIGEFQDTVNRCKSAWLAAQVRTKEDFYMQSVDTSPLDYESETDKAQFELGRHVGQHIPF